MAKDFGIISNPANPEAHTLIIDKNNKGIDEEIFIRVTKTLHQATSPNGWIIGSAIKDSLKRYFETDLMSERDIKEDSELTLLGLPYIVDNKNPERIEIIE